MDKHARQIQDIASATMRPDVTSHPSEATSGAGGLLADRVALVHRLRLGSGLVLFAFLTLHLANHAAGLVSLSAAQSVQAVFVALLRPWPLTAVLLGAFALHLGLAFWAIYRRRVLRMPAWEALQIVLGLAIPPLLAGHLIGTRLVAERFGTDTAYVYVVWGLVSDPVRLAMQLLLLLAAWSHGCIGLHYWLRLRDGYRRSQRLWQSAALLLPLLALGGFARIAAAVAAMADQPGWVAAMLATVRAPEGPDRLWVPELRAEVWAGFAAALAATFAARQVRSLLERRRERVQLIYPARTVAVHPGQTVLEASRAAGLTHVALCGGRARCGSCRVALGRGADRLPDPSPQEESVLQRIRAPAGVRLACQIRPAADLEVRPLLRRPPQGESFGDYRHALLDDGEP